ncbi:MAG: squalene synthase HpnC [Terriglobales bacterium]
MSTLASHGSHSLNSTTTARADGWAKLPAEYAIPDQAPSLEEAQAYCERLARTHYENFSVATWFLPKRLRPHFYSVYAYCRISDDLGDEVGDPQQALALLDEWERELAACYVSLKIVIPSEREASLLAERESRPALSEVEGDPYSPNGPRHPVFIALRETIRACDIPQHEFADLLKAFRQDQTVHRYETFDDVLGYCRYSANPVGHLVLYVCGYSDAERQQLSDYTCTALQLANFWQDVSVDWQKGRIYLPLEDMRRFGVTEREIAERRPTPQFLRLMKFEVERAREWFERGLPLVGCVDRELATDIELFSRGGQEILSAIERLGFDVLRQRPAISKPRKLWLVVRAAGKRLGWK